MRVKGQILPDPIRTNKYRFDVPDIGIPLTVVAVSGVERESEVIETPDGSVHPGGKTGPMEFEIAIPSHHRVQQAAMNAWFEEGQDPVTPTARKVATLQTMSGTELLVDSRFFLNCFPFKESDGDLDMGEAGTMKVKRWGMKAEDSWPI